MEGQKICNARPPKAGIGQIVKFGPLFGRHMDTGKYLYDFLKRYF
jgi:hypothetical protein